MASEAGIDLALLERASELKRDLVAFARQPRLSKALQKAATDRFGQNGPEDEGEVITFMDWFLLQHRLPSGRTVVEDFVASRRDLPDAERQLLLGWRDVVEGIFEVVRRDGDALLARNLIDDLMYRMHSNSGPSSFRLLGCGDFLVARLVPIGEEWMLSGAQNMYRRSARKRILELATKTALARPALVFRNPEKLAEGWELQRWERERFTEWFGADLIVIDGADLADRFDAYWKWRQRQTADGELPEDTPLDLPTYPLPEFLFQARTVGLIYDEVEGLIFLPELDLVQETFEDPRLLADRDHRSAVLGYLDSETISPLPFRRLALRHPEKASEVFRRLLKKPGFSWERDGEELMRRRKRWYFAKPVLPSLIPSPRATEEAKDGRRWPWRRRG